MIELALTFTIFGGLGLIMISLNRLLGLAAGLAVLAAGFVYARRKGLLRWE